MGGGCHPPESDLLDMRTTKVNLGIHHTTLVYSIVWHASAVDLREVSARELGAPAGASAAAGGSTSSLRW
jgi:hypothetical protein